MVARRLSEELETPRPLIPQFYAGKSIFITGATGFMGKVLIERLLATCPDIGNLYLLMRQKRDVLPEKRLQQLKQSQVFDILRSSAPAQLDKLRAINGDTSLPRLGMDDQGLRDMQQVSIVFHVAATLKFDEELKKAVDQNLRSIMRLMEICDTLPRIDALVHVSTAYCMAELSEVQEKVYPPPCDPHQLETICDHVDEDLRVLLTKKILGNKPNTYTFTKAMAEYAVSQHKASYPVAIYRPTIVISSLRTPMPGWIENLNGPSGVVVGAGKGLLHAFRCNHDARADLLPVDLSIDTIISLAWDISTYRTSEVRVYNSTTYDNPTTWRQFESCLRKYIVQLPLDQAMWYPFAVIGANKYIHKISEICFQTVPLYLAQYISELFGIQNKINLIMVGQRLRAMNDVLVFFSLREWRFHDENVKKLRERMSEPDCAIYNLDPNTIDWDDHYKNMIMGVRRYLLKEKDENMPQAKKHLRTMYYIHTGAKLLLFALFCRIFLQNSAVARGFVYGILRLVFSVINSLYSRFFTSEVLNE